MSGSQQALIHAVIMPSSNEIVQALRLLPRGGNRDLAKAMGVSEKTISHWKMARTFPDWDRALVLVEELRERKMIE